MLVERSVSLIASLWILLFLSHAASQETCRTPVDLIFIVDGSSSISEDNFFLVKDYIKRFVGMFDQFGDNAAQVAMIQYSSRHKMREEFHLNQYTNLEDIQLAIDEVKQLKGFTYTGIALKFLVKEALTPSHGSRLSRPGVHTVAIVITDGSSHDFETVKKWQARAKAHKVEMFAIGVGRYVNDTELAVIASEPTKKHKFFVNNFSALEQAQDLVTASDICGSLTPSSFNIEVPHATNVICKTPQDLIFILDGSTSVGPSDFKLVKEYVINFIRMFADFGPDAMQVGIIQFSNETAIIEEMSLNEYADRLDIERAIQNISYLSGVTFTGEALKYMMNVALTPSHGSRSEKPGIHTVAIVITDGRAHDPETVTEWQKRAKAQGVELYAIGVGTYLKEEELLEIASEPKENHKFNVDDFAALDELHSSLTARDICEPPQAITAICQTPQDLIFILDGSSSVGSNDFKLVKEYVIKFIRMFVDFGPDSLQVGVIQFSNKTAIIEEISLNEYADRPDIERAINNINYLSGVTYTGEALKYMMEEALTPSHGSRLKVSGIHTVAIVITDGGAHDPETVTEWQAEAKAQGVELYAIGVGTYLNEEELLKIASEPKEKHKFNVDDFPALDELHSSLTARDICDESTTSAPTTTGAPQAITAICQTPQDLIFILDGSSSVGSNDFKLVKEYVIKFIRMFVNFGPDALQVGVIQFSNKTAIIEEISLNEYSQRPDIERAINNIDYLSGVTYTGEALKYMMEEALTPSHGSRLEAAGVHTVAIVVTDGGAHDPGTVTEWQAQAKAQGVELYAIGVGTYLKEDELLEIASEPKEKHKFNVDDFPSLDKLHSSLTARDICDEPTISTPTTTGAPQAITAICQTPQDLIFILDGSSSVGSNDFKLVKEYVIKFIRMFANFGPDALQVGVIQFSNKTAIIEEISLNEYSQRPDIERAINNIDYLSGVTYTGEALKYMMEEALTPSHGSRLEAAGVHTVAIVVTDGGAHDPGTVTEWQAQAKAQGVELYAIGVGTYLKEDELLEIASEPKEKHKFNVDDFPSLDKLHSSLTARDICDEPTISTPTTTGAPQAITAICQTPQDLIFILDGSSSVGSNDFKLVKEYVIKFIRMFANFGPDALQVGVIQFSNKTAIIEEISLNEYSQRPDIERAINNIDYLSGVTYTGEALKYMMKEALTPSHGSRLEAAGIHTVAIVVTDGGAHDPGTVTEWQAQAKAQGVELYAIGVGTYLKEDELLEIASEPKEKHKFNVDDFPSLDKLHSSLTARDICDEPTISTPTTTGAPQAITAICQTPQDLVFILDGSSSVGSNDFKLVKEYVIKFIRMFANFGPDALQVGVIQFSNKTAVQEEISLNQYSNRLDIEHAVENISYLSGVTYTGEALKYMMSVTLTPSHGSRFGLPGIHTVAIVITDGGSHDPQTVLQWQATAKAQGVELFAIGVGTYLNEEELLAIASNPKITHKFNVADFPHLDELHEYLTARNICGEN